MIARWFAVFAFVLMIAVSQTRGGGDAANELKKLEGVWQPTGGERSGKPTDRFNRSKLTISGDSFHVQEGGKQLFKAALKLDSSKSPKTLDLTIVDGEEKGQVVLGIYELNNDDLKIGFSKPGSDTRPKQFATQENSEHIVIILKRDKQ